MHRLLERSLSVLFPIFCGFMLLAPAGARAFDGAEHLHAGETRLATVEDLSPTQMRIGYQEVDRKAEKIGELDKSERHGFLLANPVPVVVGPGGRLYVVDHHHLARSVWNSGHRKLYISVIDNKSALGDTAFWEFMRAKNYTYLRDDVDEKDLDPRELPESIMVMKDDPFRSLAGILRKAGGFTKTPTAFFIEFTWARALKTHFTQQGWGARAHWRPKDLELALDFAKSKKASVLPGFAGPVACAKAL